MLEKRRDMYLRTWSKGGKLATAALTSLCVPFNDRRGCCSPRHFFFSSFACLLLVLALPPSLPPSPPGAAPHHCTMGAFVSRVTQVMLI